MHRDNLHLYTHDHSFLGEDHDKNSRRLWLVIALTVVMMVSEIVAGTVYGSMALLADGWHMGTHAAALAISAAAYWVARKYEHDRRFTFGTGKFGDLAGFASAIALGLTAMLIAKEAFERLLSPRPIGFEEALLVAGIGLVVNLLSAYLLHDGEHGHGHGHGHGHTHSHSHGHTHSRDSHSRDSHSHDSHDHNHSHGHSHQSPTDRVSSSGHSHPPEGTSDGTGATPKGPKARQAHDVPSTDHNLRAAYLHVLADALTSVLAILALLLGRSYGWVWMDPIVAFVGAFVIATWSYGLIKQTSLALLDADAPSALEREIRQAIEKDDEVISDLHVWKLAPGQYAAIISVVAHAPAPAVEYKGRLRHLSSLRHLSVETARCLGC